MLHVDTKKSKWKDLSLPFPMTGPLEIGVPGDAGGTKQLRKVFPGFPVSKKPLKRSPKKSTSGDINGSN
jgi:hypothetical protein